MNPSIPRPSAALVVAMVALFAALAGGAFALPGGGTVDRNDLKRGAVTKKALKKGAVTKRALKRGAVTEKALKDAVVTAAKLGPEAVTGPAIAAGAVSVDKIAEHEERHVVTSFSNGGEGDCIWQDAGAMAGFGRVSYYKDEIGYVRMGGVAIASDGPGGDGVCDLDDPGEAEDGIVFRLPDDYLPAELVLSFGIDGIAGVIPAGGAIFAGPVPGGVVYADGGAFLSGLNYEPASSARSARAASRPPVDLEAVMRAAR
jgi:hypothetical protein